MSIVLGLAGRAAMSSLTMRIAFLPAMALMLLLLMGLMGQALPAIPIHGYLSGHPRRPRAWQDLLKYTASIWMRKVKPPMWMAVSFCETFRTRL